MGLALFFVHHHVPMLTRFFRAPCPYRWELLSLLPKPPGDKVNLFSGVTSLFQKADWEKTSAEKPPKCLLQFTVPFLALGVRQAKLKRFREKNGKRKEVERLPAPSLLSCEMILKMLYSLGCWRQKLKIAFAAKRTIRSAGTD